MQYLKTQAILFLYGLFDSIQFMKGLKHYTADQTQTYCQQIKQYLRSAMQFAGQKFLIILGIDVAVYLLSLLSIPKLLLSISWLLSLLLFIENNVRQLIYVGKISQTATQYEINAKQSRQFLIYNLTRDSDKGFSSILDQFKLTMQALLFSFLLLIQTSVFDILVLILPEHTFISTIIKHIDFLLYAVYITVGYISLKIPYQDHLPYYLHLYVGYLMGYSVILSYFLNLYFSFPKLGLVFTILSPVCMLRSFQIDAPLITEIENRSIQENLNILVKDFLGEEGLPRTSYENHLKLAENDKTYKAKSKRTIGWFTLAKGVRPYVINPLNNAIVLCLKIYNSLIGAA